MIVAALAVALALAAPVPTAAPSVTGTAKAGSVLAGSAGAWRGSGTVTYGYQWSRCDAAGAGCAALVGATGATYTLATADVGHTLYLTVTATDSGGHASADSSLVGPIAAATATLASTARPTVAGTAMVGSQVTASQGSWTQTPTAVAYAWQRCDANGRTCVAIPDAAAAAYTPVAADVGHRLVAVVEATAGTTTQPVLSTATAVVTAAAPATTLPRPAITGVAKVGQKLTAAPPAGVDAGATFAYQWYRCDAAGSHCSSVHGATGKTYTAVAEDAGRTIALTVKVTSAGTTTPAYSSLYGPIAAVTAPVALTVQPQVTGQAIAGQTLTAGAGTWSQAPAATRYAWERCNANARICLAIDGATAATYVPTLDDVGHALAVLVVTTFGTTTVSAYSAATPPVRAAVLANTAAPVAAGILRVGGKLTATSGTWTGVNPIAYHYQWYRCDAGGAHCSSVHGATKATYTLVAKDAGKTIGLTVTATDATGSKPAYASLLGPIAGRGSTFASSIPPRLTGTAVVGQVLTVDTGTWTTAPGATTVQWQRCNANGRICAAIPGATARTYTPVAQDQGHALVAVVTATAGRLVARSWSAASPPVG